MGSGAERGRTNLRLCLGAPGSSRARVSSRAWMVGTAVYQVAPWLATSSQNVDGRNRGSTTVPPVAPGDHARRRDEVTLPDRHGLRLAGGAAGVQQQRQRAGVAGVLDRLAGLVVDLQESVPHAH